MKLFLPYSRKIHAKAIQLFVPCRSGRILDSSAQKTRSLQFIGNYSSIAALKFMLDPKTSFPVNCIKVRSKKVPSQINSLKIRVFITLLAINILLCVLFWSTKFVCNSGQNSKCYNHWYYDYHNRWSYKREKKAIWYCKVLD